MPEYLDMDRVLVTKEGKATPYLESLIAQIVDSMGGESAPSVPDQILMSQDPIPLGRVK